MTREMEVRVVNRSDAGVMELPLGTERERERLSTFPEPSAWIRHGIEQRAASIKLPVVSLSWIPSLRKRSKRRGLLQPKGFVPWRAKRSDAAFHGTRALDTSEPFLGVEISFNRTAFVHGSSSCAVVSD